MKLIDKANPTSYKVGRIFVMKNDNMNMRWTNCHPPEWFIEGVNDER